jgi:hypothetical protein
MPCPPPTPGTQVPAQITPTERLLSAAEFQRLADVPPEVEWFANITNRSTRRAYENAIKDFMRFTGIVRPEEFCTVTRACASYPVLVHRLAPLLRASFRPRLAAIALAHH